MLLMMPLFVPATGPTHETSADADRQRQQVHELYIQGRYAEEIPIQEHVVQIRKTLHEDIFDFATSLDNLAVLYYFIGQYQKAEPLYKQALNIRKGVQGDHHPDYGTSVNNLAALYYSMGQYQKAEPLHQQALEITRRLGQDHPWYATSLTNLAVLSEATGRHTQALEAFDHAMQIQQANIDAVFSFTSEPAMRDFVNTTRASLDALISLGLLEGAQDPAVNQAAARWTLRRKGVVFDSLSRFQQAQRLQASDPAVAQNAE